MFFRATLFCLLMVFILAACGTPTPDVPREPTLTPFPTFEFVAPTNPPAFNVTTAAQDATTGDPELIERGRGRYETLECGACHGENGEGTDEGGSLLAFAMNETDFISFMRSGGTIGSSHQYSTDRLSERGSQSLYQYLISLGN
jgi:mono/diheme cytochrome c family protein